MCIFFSCRASHPSIHPHGLFCGVSLHRTDVHLRTKINANKCWNWLSYPLSLSLWAVRVISLSYEVADLPQHVAILLISLTGFSLNRISFLPIFLRMRFDLFWIAVSVMHAGTVLSYSKHWVNILLDVTWQLKVKFFYSRLFISFCCFLVNEDWSYT